MIGKVWEADPAAGFARRLGCSPHALGPGGEEKTVQHGGCPDIWEMSNGDVAVIGRDLTDSYRSRLPNDVTVRSDERLVIIPRDVMIAAKPDIPDV